MDEYYYAAAGSFAERTAATASRERWRSLFVSVELLNKVKHWRGFSGIFGLQPSSNGDLQDLHKFTKLHTKAGTQT